MDGFVKMYRSYLVGCLLVLVAIVAFVPLFGNGFINYDDDEYVTDNSHVRGGFTLANVGWAFTTMHESNWHPITWLSHMLDCQLFGLNPIGHHLVSLLIHIANTLLLFGIFSILTGSIWKSGFVAALFAVHPLHVESIAWVAERKDVLSTLFWMIAILAYIRYVQSPRIATYIPVIAFFALGLMAKPMVLTLPFVLLLMDFWPLRRFSAANHSLFSTLTNKKLLVEKIPLFGLTISSAIVTYIAQQKGLSVATLERYPVGMRIGNALISYVSYIGKMIIPSGLSVFYPYPTVIVTWKMVGALVIIVAITALVLWQSRRRPYLVFGWFWYLGTLVPVIGLVQVGWQAMADRYTYIPLIGLFVILAWGIPDLIESIRTGKQVGIKCQTADVRRNLILSAVACVLVIILAATTLRQVTHWRDSVTLFSHALKVTKENPVAENNLGLALTALGKHAQAIKHFKKALRIEPTWADVHHNLAIAYFESMDFEKAAFHFQKALKIDPRHARAHNNYGGLLLKQGRLDEAAMHFNKALMAKPDYAQAHINLGILLGIKGKSGAAVESYKKAIELDPFLPDAHYNLSITLGELGKVREAIESCRVALKLRPNWPEAKNNLAWLLATQKKPTYRDALEAIKLAKAACEAVRYEDSGLLDTLAAAYAAAGRYDQAISTARRALQLAITQGSPAAPEIEMRLRNYEAHCPVAN
ncbi:MAG: tetratricopeptide repeat protein [Armatimonadetes bacterium]|nr:tetratricopeptide repeat protein [Armatimonadota bacterium]